MCRRTDIAKDIALEARSIKREAMMNGLKDNMVVYDACQQIIDLTGSLIESIEDMEVRI